MAGNIPADRILRAAVSRDGDGYLWRGRPGILRASIGGERGSEASGDIGPPSGLRGKRLELREALRGRVIEHHRFLRGRLLEHEAFRSTEIAEVERRIEKGCAF